LKARVHRAFILEKQGDVDGAIAALQEVIIEHPLEEDGYLYLGNIYETLKRFPDAEAVLRQGLEMAPGHQRLHFRLGVVLDRMGERQGSISQMERVIELDPDDATALNYLGYTLAEMGVRLEEAEGLIKRALELKPGDGYFTDSLGWVYFKMGRHEEALQWIKKALESLPDDPLITEHLGDTYGALGRWQDARRAYERALRLGHENPDQLEAKLEESKKKANGAGHR
jgi:tetratricopeptide (TPR) repeat protein